MLNPIGEFFSGQQCFIFMIKVVNQNLLCGTVWNYVMMSGHAKPLLVWCQWGTYCQDNVADVLETHKMDNVKLSVNEDESADIPSFIKASLESASANEKLIIISFLPWGRDNADAIMQQYENDFESVRYEAQAEEWLNMNFAVSGINKSVIDFLKEHPDYFCLPYGEKPARNSAGPCPKTWSDISVSWSDFYSRNIADWKNMAMSKKVRYLLLIVASSIGNYESIISGMKSFLIKSKGYDNLDYVELEETGDEHSSANFTDIFNDKGELIWK